MRRLLWFAVGFGWICGLWAYQLESVVTLCILAAVCIGTMGLLGRHPIGWICIWMLLGCAAATFWTDSYEKRFVAPVAAADGVVTELTITASDYSYDTDYGQAVDGSIVLDGQKLKIRAYMDKGENVPEIAPGDEIRGSFRLRGTVSGSLKESLYHQGKGILLMAYSQERITVHKGEKLSLQHYPPILARRMEENLRKIYPEDVFAFAKALLLGDAYELDYETDTALKVSGIRHIVAVSGLHISVLYGAIAVMTGRKRFLTGFLVFPVLLLYAAVVGFTPSVTRACLMVMLTVLATMFQREYDALTGLGFSGLVILLANPLAITSVSFQMSVLCVAGILLFHQRIMNWLVQHFPGKGRWANWICSSVSVTLSATSLVTPLSALYFGSVSLIGVVTNLLTIWIITGIFIGLLVSCVIGFVSAGMASAVGWIIAWPMRFVLAAAKLCASVPFAAVYTASNYVTAWLILCYLLFLIQLVRPITDPKKGILIAGIGLSIALTASVLEPRLDDVRITMLDVGQGQSIVIQANGKCYLVDCGGDDPEETADIIAEHLLSQGVFALDGIIITHCDRDHIGALEYLLTRVDTDILILPGTWNPYRIEQEPPELLYLRNTKKFSVGKDKLTVFSPFNRGDSNENSMCVLFESEKCDILITGDRGELGEMMLMRQGSLPEVDILVAGHHGSKYSTSRDLLKAVRPELVLISVGENNIYGHPHPDLLKRLSDAGIAVRRTDQEGNIIIRR